MHFQNVFCNFCIMRTATHSLWREHRRAPNLQHFHHHRRRLHRRSEVITTAPPCTRKLHGWRSRLHANTRTCGCSDRAAAWLTRDEAVSKIVRHTRNRNPLGRNAHEPSYKTKKSYTAPYSCLVPITNTTTDNTYNSIKTLGCQRKICSVFLQQARFRILSTPH